MDSNEIKDRVQEIYQRQYKIHNLSHADAMYNNALKKLETPEDIRDIADALHYLSGVAIDADFELIIVQIIKYVEAKKLSAQEEIINLWGKND